MLRLLLIFIAITFSAAIANTADHLTGSDSLLLEEALKRELGVEKVWELKSSVSDSAKPKAVWLVRNGMSIPNYMLRAKIEIERRGGQVLWMRANGERSALLKYMGIQGVYPIVEIRIDDNLWLANSSKLAVIFFVYENDKILQGKSELLKKLNFQYNLLVNASDKKNISAGEKLNVNVLPYIYMNRVSKSIKNEDKLDERINELLADGGIKEVHGFAAYNGVDYLNHQASVERLTNVLKKRDWWFMDLSEQKTVAQDNCDKKNLECYRRRLEKESEGLLNSALRQAKKSGSALLLLPLRESSIELVGDLTVQAKKQGTEIIEMTEFSKLPAQ
ncbi:hypothetical protein AGMMS49938_15230 [Fibrobacterales bacterium]|nr:hypothetical protein AGMMS49938_15230 [Fibrobacterales bacterium]